nr:ATP-binding cassette domain-containing protein [Halobacillus sp. Marseille-Q1614]
MPSFLENVRDDHNKTAEYLMEMVEFLKEYLSCYPHELSGGQKQWVVISRAISTEPAVIIFDI